MKELTIGNATIYLGDSREILPSLGECADMVFSDIPYRLTSGGAAPPGSIAAWQLSEDYNNDGSLVECDIEFSEIYPLLYNSLRGNAHCWTMVNNRNVQEMLNEAEKAKFRFHNLAVWDKGSATPNRWLMKNCEFIGFFFKGAAKYVNDMGAKQLIFVPQENHGLHPTSKPVALCENYIRQSTVEGQTVLDPFLGSGATAIAALRSGRKFLGCEISEKWFDLSVKRITEYYQKPQQIQML